MIMTDEENQVILNYLNLKRDEIEAYLQTLIRESDKPYNQIFKAARYALLGGGKRLRPLLTLATAEMFGIPSKQALNAACAIEMVHAYSLIHDDLPCMDNDDFRRGKPTVHKAFGEGHAVLTGDYLLSEAFHVIANDDSLTLEKKVALISLLSKKSGGEGMIAGQVMDIEATCQDISKETLNLIHELKTGAMISASIEFGCIIGGALKEVQEEMRLFGNEVGLAFQIIDDVIDVLASEKKHGKKLASDALNDKTTYVTLLGQKGAEKEAYTLLENALARLDRLPLDTAILEMLTKQLVLRKI